MSNNTYNDLTLIVCPITQLRGYSKQRQVLSGYTREGCIHLLPGHVERDKNG